eukprot:scaffold191791_cov55-Attheya_sp.AAC.3
MLLLGAACLLGYATIVLISLSCPICVKFLATDSDKRRVGGSQLSQPRQGYLGYGLTVGIYFQVNNGTRHSARDGKLRGRHPF